MNICLRICIDFKGGVNQPDLSKELSYTTVLNIQPSHEAYLRQNIKNGPSKICGRQPLKNLKGLGLF